MNIAKHLFVQDSYKTSLISDNKISFMIFITIFALSAYLSLIFMIASLVKLQGKSQQSTQPIYEHLKMV